MSPGTMQPGTVQPGPGPNALAIDTTSDMLSLALARGGRPVASHYAYSGPRIAQRVLAEIDALLAGADLEARALDVLLVARGPGSFTGTRIGLAVALTFAEVLGRPLIGVDTLHLLAAQTDPGLDGVFHALLNCAREEVYHAPFRWVRGRAGERSRLECLADIRLADMATLAPEIGEAPVVLRRFAPEDAPAPPAFAGLRRAPLRHTHPDGLRLLEVGLPRYLSAPEGPFPPVEPLYLKSEAFRKWRPAAQASGAAP